MRLRDVFVSELRKKGVERIGTRLKKVMSSKDPIARMALYVANGKAEVCRSDGGLQHSFTLDGHFTALPPQAYVGRCSTEILLSREDLIRHPFPCIIVDCRFYGEHSDKERQKLEIQIKKTLGVVREYMWDEKLIVTHDFGHGNYYPSAEEFLREKGIKKVILLDPNAEELFGHCRAECFVIGGIVDKSGTKKGYTTRIGRELEKEGIDVDYRKIELRGDVVGVPDRINHITEILLKVVLDGKDVEQAIREVQPPLVAKWRLRKDLHTRTVRVCVGGKTHRVVARGEFEYFREWLNIREQDFYEVCREQRFFVVSDKVMNWIKTLKWNERRRCFRLW